MIKLGLPICPRECADSLRTTKVTTRLEIDAPLDIWDNLAGKNYEIWRCGYCGFVWGEKFFTEPRPHYSRSAIGYFRGLSGQKGWLLTPREVLRDYPDIRGATGISPFRQDIGAQQPRHRSAAS